MSFYDELQKQSGGEWVEGEDTCEIRKFDHQQLHSLILDLIFEEFRKTTDWPEKKLKFSEPDKPLHYCLKPSEILKITQDGSLGATAIFICGKQKIEEVVTIREIDANKYELKFGRTKTTFNLAELPFCPPLSPFDVISELGTKLIMEVIQGRF